MKRILLLLLFQVCFYCNGQKNKITETVYTQKLEYGFKGAVKEVIQYICKVKDGKIPTDTSDYIGMSTTTFDSLGNIIEINRLWNFGITDTITEYKMEYAGKGKDITFKEISNLKKENRTETSYKYIWSDDYNYIIIPQDSSNYVNRVTLDKNYRLIKYVAYKGDEIEYSEDIETIYQNKNIQEIKKKITTVTDGKVRVDYEIQLVQDSDIYGNPTFIYAYNDLHKQELTLVLYKKYKYY